MTPIVAPEPALALPRAGRPGKFAGHLSLDQVEDNMNRNTLGGALLVASLSALGCESETVLQVNMADEVLGASPAVNQEVGTATTTEGRGASVRVTQLPASAGDAGKWVRITRGPNQQGVPADIPSLRARFAQAQQDGNYLTTMRLFVPSGAGAATVQFEPFVGPELFGFFHVDLLPTGQVRLNDDPALVFGNFPHDQVFSLAVNFTITATQATATVTLLGAASGTMDAPVTVPLQFARQFGAVRLWMGFPHTGSFFADGVTVLRSPP
jgi:hypothetical protein